MAVSPCIAADFFHPLLRQDGKIIGISVSMRELIAGVFTDCKTFGRLPPLEW